MTAHNVDLDLDDDDMLGHLNGSFGMYGHTMSKSSHGTYLSGSAASGEPMAFAVYGNYPPRLLYCMVTVQVDIFGIYIFGWEGVAQISVEDKEVARVNVVSPQVSGTDRLDHCG